MLYASIAGCAFRFHPLFKNRHDTNLAKTFFLFPLPKIKTTGIKQQIPVVSGLIVPAGALIFQ